MYGVDLVLMAEPITFLTRVYASHRPSRLRLEGIWPHSSVALEKHGPYQGRALEKKSRIHCRGCSFHHAVIIIASRGADLTIDTRIANNCFRVELCSRIVDQSCCKRSLTS